jgi:hypothetical protein
MASAGLKNIVSVKIEPYLSRFEFEIIVSVKHEIKSLAGLFECFLGSPKLRLDFRKSFDLVELQIRTPHINIPG